MDMRDNAPCGTDKPWSWLGYIPGFANCSAADRRPRAAPACVDAAAKPRVGIPTPTDHNPAPNAVLLPFPIRGEALLVKLAEMLRARIPERSLQGNSLLLSVSRAPGSRLSIDHSAYVEFYSNPSIYHVVVEAAADTTVTLNTPDFDTLVEFVVQYVNDRLSEPATFEAAS
jgi:hypothetical protein